MKINNGPDNYQVPPEAAPHLGVVLAGLIHGGDCSGYLRNEPTEVLQKMKREIIENEPLLQKYLSNQRLPWDGPSESITETLPAIDAELLRRRRSKRAGKSPIAEIKASVDLLEEAQRHTKMTRSGPKSWKGLCPMHAEKTASFYVYPDTGRWRCYGACASGGDVIDLRARLSERKPANG